LGVITTPNPKEVNMSAKILSTAIVAGLLLAITAPAFAADAPKTKADCEKTKDMKWDDATKACVKK
jgi:ABC-type Fe2+-enterobactin transport system substrate-binding protein